MLPPGCSVIERDGHNTAKQLVDAQIKCVCTLKSQIDMSVCLSFDLDFKDRDLKVNLRGNNSVKADEYL